MNTCSARTPDRSDRAHPRFPGTVHKSTSTGHFGDALTMPPSFLKAVSVQLRFSTMAGSAPHTADAFTALYRRFAPAVHRRARSLLGDEAEAWDVTQDVFMGYFKGESRLRGEASPFTVLYQMATYQAIDRLRSRSRWSGNLRSLSVDEDSDGPALQVATPKDDVARINAAKDLALLTEGEDEQTLTAALLYFVEGYTTEELAQTLSVSRKTVGRMLAAFSERAQKRAERFGLEKRP